MKRRADGKSTGADGGKERPSFVKRTRKPGHMIVCEGREGEPNNEQVGRPTPRLFLGYGYVVVMKQYGIASYVAMIWT